MARGNMQMQEDKIRSETEDDKIQTNKNCPGLRLYHVKYRQYRHVNRMVKTHVI
jgi:hypothetical protein